VRRAFSVTLAPHFASEALLMDAPLTAEPEGRSFLRSLGLHRRELRAWAMYDWANSSFATTIMAAVLPIYFSSVAAEGLAKNVATSYWGYTQNVALALGMAIGLSTGALADYLGAKKRFLAAFTVAGALGTTALWFAGPGDWVLVAGCYSIGQIGFSGANVFYESLLPHVASEREIDRVSAAGYAIGYFGGGLLLLINAAWIMKPDIFGFADWREAMRASFISAGIWWLLFSIPLLRRVPEPARELARGEQRDKNPVAATFVRLGHTFRELRKFRDAFLFLLAFLLYNNGILTIIYMATIYGTEIGLNQFDLIGALLLVQFLGVPFTFVYGPLAKGLGAKGGIYLTLVIYMAICCMGYFMTEGWQFWLLACVVAMVQGGSQALSRSLYGSMVPPGKSSEFFSFFGVNSKIGNILGVFVFSFVGQLAGTSRAGILSLVAFFIGGMILLSRVDVARGRASAKAEEARMHVA
jgi:UMF1 family MFS transporter